MRAEAARKAANNGHVPGDSAPGDAPRLRLIPWAEMIADGPEPVLPEDWSGRIRTGSTAMLVGAGEALKSWLALYIAVSKAAGRPPFDRGPAGPARPVVYVSSENGITEDKRRCARLAAGMGFGADLPVYFLSAEDLSLTVEADFAELSARLDAVWPGLIILDSVIGLANLDSENDNAQVRRFVKGVVAPLARRYGATMLLIGHSPKLSTTPGAALSDEQVARGAGDWRNAVDSLLYLQAAPNLGQHAVRVRHCKHRHGPRHAPFWFQLEDVALGARMVYGGTFDPVTGLGGEPLALLDAAQRAVAYIRNTPGCSITTLLKQLVTAGVARSTARRGVDVIRGKAPWPGGPLKGQTSAVVDEATGPNNACLLMALSGEAMSTPMSTPDSDAD